MPWQLVALEAFDTHRPFKALPRLKAGVSKRKLKQLIRKKRGGSGSMVRIATQGWLLDRDARLVASSRHHQPGATPSPEQVQAASQGAEGFIVDAQRPDGRFRYILDPITGETVEEPFSLARQAGTTMALCEIGDSTPATLKTIGLSLHLLAGLERKIEREGGAQGYLHPPGADPARGVAIGSTALTLVALLRCRPLVGPRHDALIGRLTRTLLHQQRPEGNFHHFIDSQTGAPRADRGGLLYIDGQAVYALILMEALAKNPVAQWPPLDQVHEAAQRAMEHFGADYWDHLLGDFFFVEEHWHCLAAGAALGHHRHEPYEDLCLDFVAYKSRLQNDASSPVHPHFVGGLGYGNLTPPRNTTTTGFGESLAAAILIKRARGMDTGADEARMRAAMGFLMRNQWSDRTCFECKRGAKANGGFSQHMAALPVRIDYVQHAWATLGHGARVLEQPWTLDMPVRSFGAGDL